MMVFRGADGVVFAIAAGNVGRNSIAFGALKVKDLGVFVATGNHGNKFPPLSTQIVQSFKDRLALQYIGDRLIFRFHRNAEGAQGHDGFLDGQIFPQGGRFNHRDSLRIFRS